MSKIIVPNGVIYLDEDIRSQGDFQNRIQICGKVIHDLSEKLKMMAIANPKDIVPKGENAVSSISEQVNEIVDDITYESEQRALLNYVSEYVNAWQYSYDCDHEKIDTATQEGFDRVVLNGDKCYRSPKFDMQSFSIRNYNSLDEYIDDCISDLKGDSYEVEQEKWVILFGGKLLANENMEFTYPSYEKAEAKVIDMLSLNVHDIFTSRYIDKNKQFIEDIKNAASEEDRKVIEDYINELGDKPFIFEKMQAIYDIFKKIVMNKIGKYGLEIKKIN